MLKSDNRNCAICGGEDLERIYRREVLHPLWHMKSRDAGTVDLVHGICRSCGYIFLENSLSAEEWEDYYSHAPVPARQALVSRTPMLEERKRFIEQHLPAGHYDSLIEVGASHGDFLRLMTGFDTRVGIEPSLVCCRHMEATEPSIQVVPCDLEGAYESKPELQDSADLVVACNVLEHVTDPKAFVGYLASFAKSGGYVYIEVPSVEAMGDCMRPIYQTIHIGHLSQFSEAVINRLCAEFGLIGVATNISADHDYPVMRNLFRKAAGTDSARQQFLRHAAVIDRQAEMAKVALLEAISDLSAGEALIWGVGQDLFDVVGDQDAATLALLHSKLHLVDVNPKKHGKIFADMKIADVHSVDADKIRVVFVACRSDLLRMDITQSAGELFPGAKVVSLFSDA